MFVHFPMQTQLGQPGAELLCESKGHFRMQVPHPHQDVQVRFSSAHDSRQTCASSRADGDSAERRGWRLLAQGMPPAHRAPQDWREVSNQLR